MYKQQNDVFSAAGADITALQTLLDDSTITNTNTQVQTAGSSLNPSTLFGGNSASSKGGNDSINHSVKSVVGGKAETDQSTSTQKTHSTKDIWDIDTVPDKETFWDHTDVSNDVTSDGRKRPEYDIVYKQAVTSEDMYLGMSAKNPSTASCEHMVIKIILPGAKIADIDLDVTQRRIVVLSPTYKLNTYLPRPVQHKAGKAEWDAAKTCLTVTLPIIKQEPWEMLE